MSQRYGEIETGYIMEREKEIETGFVRERGRDRDWLCQEERER